MVFIRSISEEHFMEIEYKKPLITVYTRDNGVIQCNVLWFIGIG